MIFILLLAATNLLGKTSSLDPSKCCSSGYERGVSFLVSDNPTSCKPDPSIYAGSSGLIKLMCIGFFKSCCKSTAQSQFCQMGVRLAAANHMCITDSREGGVYQKKCCDCCKQGKAHGLSGKSCTDGPADMENCVSSFQDCCKMAKTGADATVAVKTCATFTCDSSDKECTDSDDGPTCKCKKGLREEAGVCLDIDECTSQQFNCTEHSYCSNTKGSYECLCSGGYTKQGDKCIKPAKSCATGYKLMNGTCTDTDECLSGTHRCPAHTFCMNIVGDYRCVNNCPYPSYEVIQAGVCADVNECEKKTHRCHKNYECVNLVGGFDCKRVSCDEGYRLVNGYCDDIDECAEDPNICGEKGFCRNQHGRYYCDCQAGYAVDPSTGKCADVDECQLNRAYCNYQCINTEGSFRCKCPAGYEMRSRYCYDNNECKNNPCPNTTSCFNTFGSYECINQTCPNKYYVQTSKKPGGVKNCQKVDCKMDKECSKIPLESVKRATAKFYDVAEPRDFTFNYWLNYNPRFYRVTFKLIKGNEEGYFAIKQKAHGHIQISNIRRIKGPKKFHLVLHSDINTSTGVLTWRYEYHFHIFLSAYRFGYR